MFVFRRSFFGGRVKRGQTFANMYNKAYKLLLRCLQVSSSRSYLIKDCWFLSRPPHPVDPVLGRIVPPSYAKEPSLTISHPT